ncbi:unnamed protein product [Auanema sp. JU1783]|nr:unnamed protein product [Auanema sp. JU1783]
MVCMVRKHPIQLENPTDDDVLNRTRRDLLENITDDDKSISLSQSPPCKSKRSADDVMVTPCTERYKLDWSNTQQGFIFAAQNFGSLFMLITGWQADKLNGKWSVCVSLLLLIISNSLIPLVASTSVWLVFLMRVITGMGDALLFPSASSMITRWFPPKERPFALGFVTGGRQIGTLLILPIAGVLCDSTGDFGGWKAIFYLSALICAIVFCIWIFLSADKPSKHCCVSQMENAYICRKIEEERLGKRTDRGNPPWKQIFTCAPLYVAIAALVCHEYPLVIMLQFLPKFFSDVLGLSSSVNGLVSALPSVILFITKTLSSSLSSVITSKKPPLLSKTASCKLFNFIASLGLGICVGITPLLGNIGHPAPAIIVLCLANAFAGLHTPGVQTALVQLAPAYSGIVTGISFTVVALFSIMNKLISSYILSTSSTREWTIVFEISAVVAILPVFFFTYWGSADLQPWAMPNGVQKKEKDIDQESQNSSDSTDTIVTTLAKNSMYLSHVVQSCKMTDPKQIIASIRDALPKKQKGALGDVLSFIDNLQNKSVPVQVSVGGGAGMLSGYLFTKGSKATATVLGVSLLAFQFCNYRGYIKLNSSKIEDDLRDLKKGIEKELYGRSSAIDINDKQVSKFVHANAWLLGGFFAGWLLGYGIA